MVFAPVTLLEFPEMNEGVVPGVEKEILLAALPVVGPVPGRAARQHFGDGFQELERNQIEARLAVRPPGAAGEPPKFTRFSG